MARKRIIYQSEALYAGATGVTSPTQLHRIQDVSHSVEVSRTDVNEFGKLAALSREIIESPTVSLDFTYYVVDGKNENTLGFQTNGATSALSGIMAQNSSAAEKNYYILTVPEGEDATRVTAYDSTKNGTIGVGNGYITSYGITASVGDIPSASVSVEASNLRFDTKSSGVTNPAIDITDGSAVGGSGINIPLSTTGTLSAAALRPGDVTINFGTSKLQVGGAILPGMTTIGTETTANVQNFSLDLPLSRTPLNRIGNAFPFSRELDFPINATLSVSANLTDLSSGALRDLICDDAATRDITITMKNRCASDTSVIYKLKNAQMDSQNMSSTIGDNKSVDLTFSAQIGGPEDTANGVFITDRANA